MQVCKQKILLPCIADLAIVVHFFTVHTLAGSSLRRLCELLRSCEICMDIHTMSIRCNASPRMPEESFYLSPRPLLVVSNVNSSPLFCSVTSLSCYIYLLVVTFPFWEAVFVAVEHNSYLRKKDVSERTLSILSVVVLNTHVTDTSCPAFAILLLDKYYAPFRLPAPSVDPRLLSVTW
jgi:hypothetical protein